MATDYELLDRWRAGDSEAGSELFERYFSSITRFFENKVQGDVEELVQTTFLACVDGRDQFRKQSSFRTYLFSIARYQLYGYIRKNQRDGNAIDFGVTSIIDLGTSPGSMMARQEQQEMLLQALCSLPLEQQILLELHYWEEMDNSDLADVFDIAATTVRTRLFRARAALREQMVKLSTNPIPIEMSVENLEAWARRVRDKRAATSGNDS